MNPAAQNNLASGGDNCGVWSNSNFGNPFVTTRVNPDVQHGWGVRQLRLAVRRRRAAGDPPRVSRSTSATTAAGGGTTSSPTTSRWVRRISIRSTITAPQNANLPDGGGYPVTFLTRNTRTALGATDNYFTSASDYGDVTAYWHGVDAQVSARLANQLFLQLGTSGGRGVRDYCAVAEKLPELYTTAGSMLVNQQVGIVRDQRGLADEHPRPRVVHHSQDRRPGERHVPLDAGRGAGREHAVASNGNSLSANYNVSSAILQPQTGRPLVPGLAFQTRQPPAAGAHVPRYAQFARPPRRQEPDDSAGRGRTSRSTSTICSTATRERRTTRRTIPSPTARRGWRRRRC